MDHYRDGIFPYSKSNTLRDLSTMDPNDNVVNRMLEKGGQAVRIEQPEMAPLRPRECYVGLVAVPLSEQVAAVNRARFFSIYRRQKWQVSGRPSPHRLRCGTRITFLLR